jgi:hypothetical protein
MQGLKKESFRLRAKGQSVYNQGEEGDGVCPICGEWTAELGADGTCKERACKDRRIERALSTGQGVRVQIDASNTAVIFRDTCEPLPQGIPDHNVQERNEPVCQSCGTEYKRPGDYLCVRCRQAAGPPKAQKVTKRQRFRRRKRKRKG